MPTTRPRHTITETDDVRQALDDAARRWPAERAARQRLLVRLIEEGHRAISEQQAVETKRRRELIRRGAGALTGVYPQGYLEELRRDWPE